MFLEEDSETDPEEMNQVIRKTPGRGKPWLRSLRDQCGQDIYQRDLRISFLIERLIFISLKGSLSVKLDICC